MLIAPSTLSPGAQLIFTLKCTTISTAHSSSASIVININESPIGGTFTVTPMSGVEFQDSFFLSYWSSY
jgi:hypothetical protein